MPVKKKTSSGKSVFTSSVPFKNDDEDEEEEVEVKAGKTMASRGASVVGVREQLVKLVKYYVIESKLHYMTKQALKFKTQRKEAAKKGRPDDVVAAKDNFLTVKRMIPTKRKRNNQRVRDFINKYKEKNKASRKSVATLAKGQRAQKKTTQIE